jgi:hypothetical protein
MPQLLHRQLLNLLNEQAWLPELLQNFQVKKG